MKRILFLIFSLLLTSVLLLQNASPKVYTLERTLSGHTENVLSVAFSPDGKVLASSSDDKTARLWNPTTGQLLNTLSGHLTTFIAGVEVGAVLSVSFSPDGQTLTSGGADDTVRLWKLTHSGN